MTKASLFNIGQPVDNGGYLLYNTLTTSLVVLERDLFEQIFDEMRFEQHSETVNRLIEMGFLVKDGEFDEREYLKRLRHTTVYAGNDIFNVVVAPTMACNARCSYCFEQGTQPVHMSKETAEHLVDFLDEHCQDRNLSIQWFGGEPLLAVDIIDYVCDTLQERGIALSGAMTTNGFLVNDEIIQRAEKRWNVESFQITIDALNEEYDHIKNYVGAGDRSPFEVVLDNIMRILEAGLGLNLRVNYNPLEADKTLETIQYMDSLFGHFPQFCLYCEPINSSSADVPAITQRFPDADEHPLLKVFLKTYKCGYFRTDLSPSEQEDERYGNLLENFMLRPHTNSCYAACTNAFAVDASGDLFKCHRLLGRGSDYSCGNIATGIEHNKAFTYFCNEELTNAECENCSLLPICQGGCKANRLLYDNSQACAPAKAVYKQLIRRYYEELVGSPSEGR